MTTLTYEGPAYELTPEHCHAEFGRFRRRLRAKYDRLPWVEVLQRGEDGGRLHHHVLLPDWFEDGEIDNCWMNGITHVQRAEHSESIRAFALYITQEFSTPLDRRLGCARYRVAREGHERLFTVTVIGTRQELESLAYRHAGEAESLQHLVIGKPFCSDIYQWEPQNHEGRLGAGLSMESAEVLAVERK